MTSVATARDIMLADATNACSPLPMTYDDVAPAAALNGTAAWARATVKHASGGQHGFGGDGTTKYLRMGVLAVEIFTPVGTGLGNGDVYVQQVLTYLENTTSSPVWYRNIRASEMGRDGGYSKINVYADFEYESNH